MDVMLDHHGARDGPHPEIDDPSPPRRQSAIFSLPPDHHDHQNAIATGTIIEELLSVKYDGLNDAEQTDIATTIRNAILIPTNLNVSDDCLRILCNKRAQDASLILDTTAESLPDQHEDSSPCSNNSEPISDQDLRCARELAEMGGGGGPPERRQLRQVSPLPKGLIISGNPVLHGENSGNAVFDRIGETPERLKLLAGGGAGVAAVQQPLTFNGRIPAPPLPRPDHVVIQIEPDTSSGRISLDPQPPQQAASDNDKSGTTSAVEESFEFTNERSPDLFAENEDEEAAEEEDDDEEEEDFGQHNDAAELQAETVEDEEEEKRQVAVTTSAVDRLMKRDNHLLKRLQTAFSGVLPPPSVTNVAISLDVIVSRYKEFNGQMPDAKTKTEGAGEEQEQEAQLYLLKSVDSPTKAKTESWPELKNVICHDVYYNLSNAIEQYEYLTVKYRSRFSGSDTASSFVLADLSSAKKRANRTKALNSNNSPGRRLSHLARRRAIFSCANLQGAKEAAAQAQQAAVDLSKVAHRQILLPTRRFKKGTTPGKKRKTPGSSAKKQRALALAMGQRREALTRETSKRALFQSPGNGKAGESQQAAAVAKPKVTPEVAVRVEKSKRALFSSPKFGRYPTFSGTTSTGTGGALGGGMAASSSRLELSKLRYGSMTSLSSNVRGSQESLLGKRKRRDGEYSDEDEENHVEQQCSKVLRTESPTRRSSLGSVGTPDVGNESLTMLGGGSSGGGGGKSFMRSQSFTAEQLYRQKSTMGRLPRTSSEMHINTSGQVLALNEAEKKKLLWVVSQTLLRNQIDGKNAKFKEYATVMAKVVKRLYLDNPHRNTISVTEQMSRLANNVAFQVLQNKDAMEIYSAEKLRSQAQNRKKLTGYVNTQEYEQFKAMNGSTHNISRMRRMSSGVFSETSSVSLSQCSAITVTTAGMDENLSQAAAESTVLRENVDTEQRQQLRLSSQKSGGGGGGNLGNLVFNGKDQKNVSPYSGGGGLEGARRKLLVGGGTMISATGPPSSKGLNVIKAKRQISFDA